MVSTVQQQKFGFTVLGSGSKGNATVIHCPDGKNILLDAGFSAKELCTRMDKRAIAPESICGILITHSHDDHIRGCRVFADRFGLPVYETPETAQRISAEKNNATRVVLITPGHKFDLCGLTVEPFAISHDVDAVAYTFHCNGMKLGYATDLGFTSLLVNTKLKSCHALVLESNYEPEYLRNSGRPLHTKRRIMGRQGHLSNQDAMEAMKELLCCETAHVVLAHLSRECNDRCLVEKMLCETLTDLRREDVSYAIASQDEPLETIWIEK